MARVVLRRLDAYDPQKIQSLIEESMEHLGFTPHGQTMVKPNTVIAHHQLFQHAFTRPEFLDGLLGALTARATKKESKTSLCVGERCGITIPTRFAFAEAGYNPVLSRHKVQTHFFDECEHVPFQLTKPGRLRDTIHVPKPITQTDCFVTAPKFKAHPWTKVTFNLKLYIGIQDDAYRLLDHDHRLHTKIADLFEVIPAHLCVVDGIVAGADTMLTPKPFPLGLIIMGDNAVATDAVCTHIAGLDPKDVEHIQTAFERGFGPIALDHIQVEGDVTLEQARARAKGFTLSLDRVDTIYNNRSNLHVHVGPPPDTYDYCSGGCPGALHEAMGIVEQMQPEARLHMKKTHVVFGAYAGSIEASKHERVLFIGDCTSWKGTLCGKQIEQVSYYKDCRRMTCSHAGSADLLVKLFSFIRTVWTHRRKQAVRIKGCPVSVAEHVLCLSWFGKTKNPYLHPQVVFRFTWHYLVSRFFKAYAKWKGWSLQN